MSLWDSSEVACVRTIDKADSQIRGVSFSFSGEHLAVACGDKDESNKTLDIFRVTDGARIRSVPVRESCSVNYVAWAPQSMVLAFALDELIKDVLLERFQGIEFAFHEQHHVPEVYL